MEDAPLDQIALMLVRERRLALALAPADRWTDLYGQRMLRLEFPSAAREIGCAARDQARDLSEALFGCGAMALPTDWTYGPSARHAVDRQLADTPDAPFLRFTRFAPPDEATGAAPRPISIALFRAAPLDEMAPDPRVSAGALWLPLAALQTLMRGARVEDALALAGVEARLAAGVALPSDGLIYLPADVGERMLPRIAAKYGERVLFATLREDA